MLSQALEHQMLYNWLNSDSVWRNRFVVVDGAQKWEVRLSRTNNRINGRTLYMSQSIHEKNKKKCWRQPFKNLKGHCLPKVDHTPSNFLKTVFHKTLFAHFWILWLICSIYLFSTWYPLKGHTYRSFHLQVCLSISPFSRHHTLKG